MEVGICACRCDDQPSWRVIVLVPLWTLRKDLFCGKILEKSQQRCYELDTFFRLSPKVFKILLRMCIIQPARWERQGCYWQTVPQQWGGGRLFGALAGFFFMKTAVTRKQKVEKSIWRCLNDRNAEGYKRAIDENGKKWIFRSKCEKFGPNL